MELTDRWPAEPGRPQSSDGSDGLAIKGGSIKGPPHGLPLSPLPGRLRSALEAALLSDEEVRAVVHGEGGSAMIGTDCRALVFKRGAKAGAPFGIRLKAFEYEIVTSVAVRPVQQGAVLVVHAPLKIAACSSYWIDERDDAWRARNAIPVKPPLEKFSRFAGLLAQLVEHHQALHGRVTSGFAPDIPAPPAAPITNGSVELAAPAVRCGRCGAENQPDWRYCPECGTAAGARGPDAWAWLRGRTRS